MSFTRFSAGNIDGRFLPTFKLLSCGGLTLLTGFFNVD
jgi:hypothetical protein